MRTQVKQKGKQTRFTVISLTVKGCGVHPGRALWVL